MQATIKDAIITQEFKSDDDIGNKFTFKDNIIGISGQGNKCLLNAFFCSALEEADRNGGVADIYGNIMFALSHYPQNKQLELVKKVLFTGKDAEYQVFKKIFDDEIKVAEENKTVTEEELTNCYPGFTPDLSQNQSIRFDSNDKKFYIYNNNVKGDELKELDSFFGPTQKKQINAITDFQKIVEERKKEVIYKAIIQYITNKALTDDQAKKTLGQGEAEQTTGIENLTNARDNGEMLEITSAGALLCYISGRKLNVFSQNDQNKMSVSIFDKDGKQKTARVVNVLIKGGNLWEKFDNGTEQLIDKLEINQFIANNSKNSFIKKAKYINSNWWDFEPINLANLDINGMINDKGTYMIEISQNLLALPENKAILEDKNAVNLFHEGLHYSALTKAPTIEVAKQVAAQKSVDPSLITAAKARLKGLLDVAIAKKPPTKQYNGKGLSDLFSASYYKDVCSFHSLDENKDVLNDIKTLLGKGVCFYKFMSDEKVEDLTEYAELSLADSNKLMVALGFSMSPIIAQPNPPIITTSQLPPPPKSVSFGSSIPIAQPNPPIITTPPQPKPVNQYYTQTIDSKGSQYVGYNLYKIQNNPSNAIRAKGVWEHKAIVDTMFKIFNAAVKEARRVKGVDQAALKDSSFLAAVVQFAQANGGVAKVKNALEVWKTSPLVPAEYRSEKHFYTAKAVSGEYQHAAKVNIKGETVTNEFKTGREEELKPEQISARLFRTPEEFAKKVKNANFSSGPSK